VPETSVAAALRTSPGLRPYARDDLPDLLGLGLQHLVVETVDAHDEVLVGADGGLRNWLSVYVVTSRLAPTTHRTIARHLPPATCPLVGSTRQGPDVYAT